VLGLLGAGAIVTLGTLLARAHGLTALRYFLDRAEKARPRIAGGGIVSLAVIARLDRATQYSVTVVIEFEASDYWMPRLHGA